MQASFEEMLALVLAQLSEPVEQRADEDGAVLVTGGDPAEVIVRLTSSQVTVAQYAVSWHSPDEPVVEPIHVGTVSWKAISSDAAVRAVRLLLAAARESRLATFTECIMCGRSTPPESMHDDEVCQRCAERDAGTVH